MNKTLIALVFLLFAIPARGAQSLGVAVVPQQKPLPTSRHIVKAFDLAYNTGCRTVQMGWTWKSLELSPGVFNLTDVSNTLSYIEARGFDVILNIQVLNTNIKETPPDLLGVSFADDAMKSRFRALLDALQPYLTARVRSISVGNEVDAFLNTYPWEWTPYAEFYSNAAAHIHAIAPGIAVGVTMIYDSVRQAPDQANLLNQFSDVWVLTYYPLRSDFTVREPTEPLTDFPAMLQMAGGKPVILQECGYPSSRLNASSQKKQAQFVQYAFQAWRAAGDQMPILSYFALHDFTRQQTKEFTHYYGFGSSAFRAFLGSLGLHNEWGVPKRSWRVFQDGAAGR